MKLLSSSRGFSIIEVVGVIGVVAVIGLVGFNVYARNQGKTDTATSSQQSGNGGAPEIKSSEDLTKADKALDDTNLDTDTSQLDSQLGAF